MDGKREFAALRTFMVHRFSRFESDPLPWIARGTHQVERARHSLSTALRSAGDRSGSLRALILSERPPGIPSDWLRTLGFVHVFSAAGIHLLSLGLVCSQLFPWAFQRALGRLGYPAMDARWTARLGLLFGVGVWAIAWVLGGFRAGFVRPWLVWITREASLASGTRLRRWVPLVACIGLDIGLTAWGFYGDWGPQFQDGAHHGRWIYSLAVGGGALGLMAFPKQPHLGLSLGSWAPVAIYEGLQRSWISVATPGLNFLSLPLFGWIAYPLLWLAGALALIGVPPSSFLSCFEMVTWASEWLLNASCESISGAGGVIGIAPWAWIVAMPLALVARPKRLLLLLLILCSWRFIGALPTPTRLEQLDVSQGDSVLVSLASGHRFLVDTGSAPERGGLRPTEWIELLSQRSIHHLDAVLLTHLDEDHAGGLEQLLQILVPDCVLATERAWNTPSGRRLKDQLDVLSIARGTVARPCYSLAGATIKLWDLTTARDSKRGANNTGMMGIRIASGSGDYLNLGDASSEQEQDWLRRMNRPDQSLAQDPIAPHRRIRVLKVSHHGSRFSSDLEFLHRIRPEEAWISSGSGNPHGHPTHEALSRLKAIGSRVRRTDLDGALSLPWQSGHR